MKTLVIDNYDSFTWNLVHYLAEANQEEPLVLCNDQTSWAEIAALSVDNIVISPGPGRPDRTDDFGVCAEVIARTRLPVLGVCLGHQGIGALYGARVVRAPQPRHGEESAVRHSDDPLFAGIPSPFRAVRYHSLAVASPLRPPLVETAWAEDGVLMGLRHSERPIWGVQFHPESVLTEHGHRLIENFRDLTRATSRSPRVAASPRDSAQPPRRPSVSRVALWRELPRAIDTEAAFVALFGAAPAAFWLDSSLADPTRARWSFLGDASGLDGALVVYDGATGQLSIRDAGGERNEQRSVLDYLAAHQPVALHVPRPFPFVGGHVGWLGYEMRRECGAPTPRRAATPDALLIRPSRFVAVDHVAGRTYLVTLAGTENSASAERWLSETSARLFDLPAAEMPNTGGVPGPIRFALDRDRATYLNDVERCLDWIRDGESYQVCLTNEIVAQASVNALDLYRVLRRVNPAPHAAFLQWPGGAVLSASPERFLSVDAEGRVEAKPIKGTLGRSTHPVLDCLLSGRLSDSAKDRAENLMIVDLLRNDLSRVCEPGSVVTPALMAVEHYSTVHQLVSTIRGRLRPDQTIVDLVRAAFPGGSMTGAPKLRAMSFIDQLEQRPRGIYSGALGWFGDDGAADLSIVIRTIVAEGGRLRIGVGGGIVLRSTPQGEFAEMLLKAEASIRAIIIAATGAFEPDRYTIEGLVDAEPRETDVRQNVGS